MKPVIRGVRYFLAHTPGLIRHGSKPAREIAATPGLLAEIMAHRRCYEDAVAYPPNRALLGSLYPDDLRALPRPWFRVTGLGERRQPHGETMPEAEFYGLLRICDVFDLVWLEADFAREVREQLTGHPLIREADLDRLSAGMPASAIAAHVAAGAGALPLHLGDGRLIGCVNRAHDADVTLTADVLLENLACKATAVMALRTLLADERLDPAEVFYVLNSGEEAVGERYQRGGGNLAKAVGEMSGLTNATGSDVKAFCCGPLHALVMAGALVSAGVFRQVAVVAGCSLAKLGMKFQGHLRHDQPILEDTLAALAVLVSEDDGVSPVMRLDAVGCHTVGAGSSQQAIVERLVREPLARLGLGFRDIDKYATELQNPELTEPAGSGDVAKRNYQLIGALAAANKEITAADIPEFTRLHGLPGFSPTQGHIASAVPFLAHGVDRIRDGRMQRAMFLAKGSLFLGRMTQGSDGLSVVLERNPGA